MKHTSTKLHRKKVNEKTIERSTEIRLIDDQGEIVLELVDDAVAIDGRWYITRLCTDRVEQKLQKNTAIN